MVTQQDIASYLKTSRSTVSAVLNNNYTSKKISDEKRAEIKKVAKELGYVFDDMARSVKTGKSRVIGLISNGSPSELVQSLNLAAEKSSFLLKSFMVSKQEGEDPIQRMKTMTNIILSQRLAGVVINYGTETVYSLIEEMEKRNIPCVSVSDYGREFKNISSFCHGNYSGGEKAAEYLYELGHRNFLCIAGGKKNLVENLRVEGFVDSLKGKGIFLDKDRIITGSNALERNVQAKKILEENKDFPLAVFCTTNSDSIALLTLCYSMSLRIPDDVSIVGYGNNSIVKVVTPALTSIEEDFVKCGFEACKALLATIETNAKPTKKIFDVELVVRNSCKAVKIQNKI